MRIGKYFRRTPVLAQATVQMVISFTKIGNKRGGLSLGGEPLVFGMLKVPKTLPSKQR